MCYAPPGTFSLSLRVALPISPSAARKVPLPVVSGFGSESPYVLLLALVVQVAGLVLMVRAEERWVREEWESTAAGASVEVKWYGPRGTVTPAARVWVALTSLDARKAR